MTEPGPVSKLRRRGHTSQLSGFGDVTVNTAANMIRISARVQTAQIGDLGIDRRPPTRPGRFPRISAITSDHDRQRVPVSGNTQTLLERPQRHSLRQHGRGDGAHLERHDEPRGRQQHHAVAGTATPSRSPAVQAAASRLVSRTAGTPGEHRGHRHPAGVRRDEQHHALAEHGRQRRRRSRSPGSPLQAARSPVVPPTSGTPRRDGDHRDPAGAGRLRRDVALADDGCERRHPLHLRPGDLVSLVGTYGISVSTNGSTISIMQTTGSAYLTSMAPYDESPMVTGQQGQGSLHIIAGQVPGGRPVRQDRARVADTATPPTRRTRSRSRTGSASTPARARRCRCCASTSITTNFTGSGTVGSYSLYGGPKLADDRLDDRRSTEGDCYVAIVDPHHDRRWRGTYRQPAAARRSSPTPPGLASSVLPPQRY